MSENNTDIQAFKLSSDLTLSKVNNVVTIRRKYKHRGIYIGFLSILAVTLLFFTGLILQSVVWGDQRDAWVGVIFILIIDVGMFFLLKSYLFAREVLSLDLTEKSITYKKNRKKAVTHHFSAILQWQLIGVIRQLPRSTSIFTRLYLRLKYEPKDYHPLIIFDFYSGSPKEWLSANQEHMKKSAYEKGAEVTEWLKNVTQIHWKWYDYRKAT